MGQLSEVASCRQAPTQSSQVPWPCEQHRTGSLPVTHLPTPKRTGDVALGSDVTQRPSSVSTELWPLF